MQHHLPDMSLVSPPTADWNAEIRGAAVDFVRLVARRRRLPQGEGSVMVIPGYATSDRITWLLRRNLAQLGYRTHGWGFGVNDGEIRKRLPAVVDRVRALNESAGEPIFLVGWSLGGLFAREVARHHPELVRHVITLATPVVGGPKYTVGAARARARGVDLDAVEAEVDALNREKPIEPNVTALYTRADSIVAWQSCIDPAPENGVEHIEIDTTHAGFGFNHDVLRIIAERFSEASEA